MNKIRSRLILGFLILIITVLIGLGVLQAQLLQSYFVHSLDERMLKEIQFISSHIEKNSIHHLDTNYLDQASSTLSVRLTIMNEDFQLLYDSKGTTVDRTIFIKLIDGYKKTNVSHSTISTTHYYWKEIMNNGNSEGYIFLSTEQPGIHHTYKQIWMILAISLGAAFIIIILLGARITLRFTKPLERASNVALELARGNYRVRTYEDIGDETGALSASLNVLARNLEHMVIEHEVQKDRLMTLIENMGSGLLFIDSKGYITLTNRTFKEVFQVKDETFLNKLYLDVIPYQDICYLIEEVFMTEKKVRKQVQLMFSMTKKHFEVYGAPIISQGNEWKGIVLVFHDITELKKLEQIRKDFVANVSHELKTPITSIKGFAETLLDGALNDPKTLKSFLSIILNESERLQTLINDLLELSKIEQHNFRLTIENIDLVKIVSESIEILSDKANRKDIQIHIHSDEPTLRMKGDPRRLKQIFINIIDNAITYTPNQGDIKIRLNDLQDKVRVTITDTGIGISKEEIPRIFERFYRVDRARSRESGGTGLGLAIVKHLMEAHHGYISVESEIGKGTSFHLTFPKGTYEKK
jgi:two-component system, OmpR family, phosphate regulon sensor histidine kinase PhoR